MLEQKTGVPKKTKRGEIKEYRKFVHSVVSQNCAEKKFSRGSLNWKNSDSKSLIFSLLLKIGKNGGNSKELLKVYKEVESEFLKKKKVKKKSPVTKNRISRKYSNVPSRFLHLKKVKKKTPGKFVSGIKTFRDDQIQFKKRLNSIFGKEKAKNETFERNKKLNIRKETRKYSSEVIMSDVYDPVNLEDDKDSIDLTQSGKELTQEADMMFLLNSI